MQVITFIIAVFSLAGAADYLFGNKLGLGGEFKRAFSLFAPMALSMLGMIVIAPAIGVWLTPAFEKFYLAYNIDPSVIPASLFANDMGGMQLSKAVCKTEEIGLFNAFIVSSMMGCVISFTIPFSLGIVDKSRHKALFFGLLCGIVTVPVGCFAAGLLCGLEPMALGMNLLPLILFSVAVGLALILFPKVCIGGFTVFGFFMKFLGIAGLACAIFTFLTGVQISDQFDTFENAAFICANACVTLSGALPFMFAMEKLLKKPLGKLGKALGINTVATLALLGNLVTNASVFGVMDKMDRKGIVLTSAFAVSAAFVFGSHLAFTMAFDDRYVVPVILGKLVSGVCALVLALLIYKRVPVSEQA